jgi:hypothetical protein
MNKIILIFFLFLVITGFSQNSINTPSAVSYKIIDFGFDNRNTFSGLCKIGSVQGNSYFDFTKYTIKSPILRVNYSAFGRSATEIGILRNFRYKNSFYNNTKIILADWLNLDKNSGSGTFEISLLDEGDPNKLYIGINGSNWSYYINIKLKEDNFREIIKLLTNSSKPTNPVLDKKKILSFDELNQNFVNEIKNEKNIYKIEAISAAQIQMLLQLNLEIPKDKLVINEYKVIDDSLRLYRTKVEYNDKDKENSYLFFGVYPSYDVVIFNIENYVLSSISGGRALTMNSLCDLTSNVKLILYYSTFPGGTSSYDYKYLDDKTIVDSKVKKNLDNKYSIYIDPYNIDMLFSKFKTIEQEKVKLELNKRNRYLEDSINKVNAKKELILKRENDLKLSDNKRIKDSLDKIYDDSLRMALMPMDLYRDGIVLSVDGQGHGLLISKLQYIVKRDDKSWNNLRSLVHERLSAEGWVLPKQGSDEIDLFRKFYKNEDFRLKFKGKGDKEYIRLLMYANKSMMSFLVGNQPWEILGKSNEDYSTVYFFGIKPF